MHNRGTRPKSYDRGEPSGGLAGAAPRVIKGGWAQEVAWSPKHVPETAVMQRQYSLHGPVRGTLSADGDIQWSHGYTSRKERGRWERGATAAAGAGGAAAGWEVAKLAYNAGALATGNPTTGEMMIHAAEFAVGEVVGAAVAAEAAGGGAAAAAVSAGCSIQ